MDQIFVICSNSIDLLNKCVIKDPTYVSTYTIMMTALNLITGYLPNLKIMEEKNEHKFDDHLKKKIARFMNDVHMQFKVFSNGIKKFSKKFDNNQSKKTFLLDALAKFIDNAIDKQFKNIKILDSYQITIDDGEITYIDGVELLQYLKEQKLKLDNLKNDYKNGLPWLLEKNNKYYDDILIPKLREIINAPFDHEITELEK